MPSRLSILQNFRDSMVKRDPFPYLVIENALPAEIYEQLAGHYPSESFIFENRRGKQANEAYQSNKRYDLPAAHLAGANTLDLGLWRDFIEYHTSQDFLDELLSKLGDVIADTHPELISLADWNREFIEEFSSTLELSDDVLTLTTSPAQEVRMDPSHLRQICWNLCENAVKHGADAHGNLSIRIKFGRMPGNQRPFLEVSDRGEGISAEMREHLFEPFATGRTGGTGLGLFISRELCECNRAALIFEPRQKGGSTFRIVFADPERWTAES